MKANEYFKKHGWEKVKRCKKPSSRDNFFIVGGEVIRDKDLIDLKRLIESHELVETCGGLQSVGEKLTHGMYESRAVIDRLKQAIADVESCQ